MKRVWDQWVFLPCSVLPCLRFSSSGFSVRTFMKSPFLFPSSWRERGSSGAWRQILLLRKTWRSKGGVTARQAAEGKLYLSQWESSILALSLSQQVSHAISLCLVSLPVKPRSWGGFVLTPACYDFNPSSSCVVAHCLMTSMASLKKMLWSCERAVKKWAELHP